MTTLHITNGDSAVEVLRNAGESGQFLPWRDLLHEGPVPAGLTFSQMCDVRQRYLIQSAYGQEELIQRSFDEHRSILSRVSEFTRIVLWFEHDLYDQLQLLQVLDYFSKHAKALNCLQLVQSDDYLGMASSDDIDQWSSTLQPVTDEQFQLATLAWSHFCSDSPESWAALLKSDTRALPYLHAAVLRMLEEYPSPIDGLTRTERVALDLVAEGEAHPGRLFAAYGKTEEARFLGDLSFWRVLHRLIGHHPPLLQQTAGAAFHQCPLPNQTLAVTEHGKNVLKKTAKASPFEQSKRWYLGGVELSTENRWTFDVATHTVAKEQTV